MIFTKTVNWGKEGILVAFLLSRATHGGFARDLEPWVVQCFCCRRSLILIEGHEPLEEGQSLFANIVEVACSHLERPRFYLTHDVGVVFAIEGWSSSEHYVKDDTC